MTTDIRQQAEAAAKMIDEINAVVLPDPSADLIPLPQADAPTAEQIRARMAQIDMGDTNSIVSFGSSAQAELQQISQAMLQGVKNKDVGPAGDSLREIVGTIRGFSVDELDPNRKQSWWERLFGRAKPRWGVCRRGRFKRGAALAGLGYVVPGLGALRRAACADARAVAESQLDANPDVDQGRGRQHLPHAVHRQRPAQPAHFAYCPSGGRLRNRLLLWLVW